MRSEEAPATSIKVTSHLRGASRLLAAQRHCWVAERFHPEKKLRQPFREAQLPQFSSVRLMFFLIAGSVGQRSGCGLVSLYNSVSPVFTMSGLCPRHAVRWRFSFG
ncbi:hypothetical protein TcG_13265 [Trypanosoma cruzi]|nr:hypothetical protein TcG_13265 [Trypanosoma cruzi]